MLGEIQTTQHTLATVMEKIQNHLMKDGNQDDTSNVEETPAISEFIPPQAGPSGEIVEPNVLSGTSFQADLGKQLRQIKEIQLAKIPEGTESVPIGPVATLTEPVISRVRAPTLAEPIYRKRCNSGNAIGDSSRKQRQAYRYSSYDYSGWRRRREPLHTQKSGGTRKIFWD